MSPLDRKLLRDLVHLRGQVAAVLLVVTCGIALFVTLRSMHAYLLETQAGYYESHRFAEVFARLGQIRKGLSMEGDLKSIAREGLD